MCLDINRAIYLYKDPLVACVRCPWLKTDVKGPPNFQMLQGGFPKYYVMNVFGKLSEISIRIILLLCEQGLLAEGWVILTVMKLTLKTFFFG